MVTALRLQQAGLPYVLYEAGSEPGGCIRSRQEGPYLREEGANSLLAGEGTEALLHELGLENEILPAEAVSNFRYIYKNGKIRQLPAKPRSLMLGGYFSLKAKFSILRELRNKSRGPENETLADFFRRRFGEEVVRYALDPFVNGIYAGNSENLLVKLTFPQLLKMEKEYGSVLKGMANLGGKRRKTLSFKNGLQTLPIAIAEKLNSIKYRHTLTALDWDKDGFTLNVSAPDSGAGFGKGSFQQRVNRVIMCLPAYAAAPVLADSFPELSAAAAKLEYPPMAAVHTAWKRSRVSHPLNGFGALHPPHVEKLFTAGTIWTSSVFPGRCPADEVFLTTFIGGSVNPENAGMPNEALISNTLAELRRLYGITGEPEYIHTNRWPLAIPQYDAHMLPVNAAADAAKARGLFICANWQGGVSIEDCIRKGGEMAGVLKG